MLIFYATFWLLCLSCKGEKCQTISTIFCQELFVTRRVVLIKFKGLLVALVFIAPIATSNGTPNGGGCYNGWHDGFFGCHKPHGNSGEPSWFNSIGNYLDSSSCVNNPGSSCRMSISGSLCPPYSSSNTPDGNGYCYPD